MPRILITGASGLLGSNLALETSVEHDVIAQYFQHPLASDMFTCVRADLTVASEVDALFERYQPDWVINCAALTTVDVCERKPELTQRLNVDLPAQIARAARACAARMIHISTDAVFDGKQGYYTESDPVNPLNVYARSKAAAEELVRQIYPAAAVVRTNLFGWNAQQKFSLAEWFLDNLRSRRGCKGFTDAWVNPILVNDLASVLTGILTAGLSGIWHVGSSECINKYQFGRLIAGTFTEDAGLIEPVKVAELGLIAPRAPKLCLDCTRIAEQMEIRLPTIWEGLQRMRRLEENGYRERLKDMI